MELLRLVAWREAVRVAAGRDYASVLIATEPGFHAALAVVGG